MNAVTIQPSRMPIPPAVAKEFQLQPAEWRVLVEQIFPAAKSVESVMMALAYCRQRKLDIFKKPVHIVPMWSSAKRAMVETVWPGIAEIRTTASRTGVYAGIDAVEFGPVISHDFHGKIKQGDKWEDVTKTVRFPEWASVVVYRIVGGEKCAYHAKVFWEETYASVGKSDIPNDMWAKRPRGQLDKCVEAAALRKAFPEELGNTYAAEEMEGRTIDGEAVASTTPPQPPTPPSPPQSKVIDVEPETIDAETGEITEPSSESKPAEEVEVETLGAYFTNLETALALAGDAPTLEEIWNEFDPLAKFEGDEDNQALAKSLKRKHLQRIGAK